MTTPQPLDELDQAVRRLIAETLRPIPKAPTLRDPNRDDGEPPPIHPNRARRNLLELMRAADGPDDDEHPGTTDTGSRT